MGPMNWVGYPKGAQTAQCHTCGRPTHTLENLLVVLGDGWWVLEMKWNEKRIVFSDSDLMLKMLKSLEIQLSIWPASQW